MRPAFYLTIPQPEDPRLDAAVQEAELLRARFGGEIEYLYPGKVHRRWLPRRWLPASQRRIVSGLDGRVSLHHVVSDRLRTYDAFATVTRPVVLRLLTPPRTSDRDLGLRRYAAVVASSRTDARTLEEWGVARVAVIPPAIDVDRYRKVAPPPAGPFTLMMASAPWTRRQFRTKGVDALLEAVERDPELRLILLWRDALVAAAETRLARSRAGDRIELLRGYTDVEEVLGRSHAVVLATTNSRVVKGYPHSLLEGLAAGRPLLTSSALRISEFVAKAGCGVVTDPSLANLGEDIAQLRSDYQDLQRAAAAADLSPFSQERFIDEYRQLYAELSL